MLPLLSLARIFAQELVEQEARIYIKDIKITIEGRTKKRAVLLAGDFDAGKKFKSIAELEQYIAQKEQRLINQRVLTSVKIDYVIEEENGRQGIILLVNVRDSRNFLVLPTFKYENGVETELKIYDYNFLGTMTLLKVGLGYTLDEFHIDDGSKGVYWLTAETDYPFNAAGLEWNTSTLFGINFVVGETFSFKNITGLSVNVPLSKAQLQFSYTHGTLIGEEYYSFEKAKHADIFEPINYMYSLPQAKVNVPLGFKTEKLGELKWTNTLSTKFNYRLSGNALEWREGPTFKFLTDIGFEHIDWLDNFREGYKIGVDAGSAHNTHFNEWQNKAGVYAISHKKINDFFAVSSRFSFTHWFNNVGTERDTERLESGSMLRGIANRSLVADTFFLFNFDIVFRLPRFLPSEWFKKRWLRYFDAELQISPILDIAAGSGTRLNEDGGVLKKLNFDKEDVFVCGGFEAVLFILTWRSVFIRFSFAWNLREAGRVKALPSGDNSEIYIGIGHLY